ncbi:hypothetical protein NKH43_26310 [Mesorhizobium sp. M1163]
MRLARVPGMSVRPVCRSKGGSAFLRHKGISVVHADVSRPEEAAAVLRGADVVVNLALALGQSADAQENNKKIIEQSFVSSAPNAKVIFFSTLAIHGEYDARGRRLKTYYGRLKRQNEKDVELMSKNFRAKTAFILRLGHVIGDYQNLTRMIREEISSSEVRIIDLKRHSNVVHVATIVDAICKIATGRAGPPGQYDLVNVPQWSWQELYEYEARRIGQPLKFPEHQTGFRENRRRTRGMKAVAVDLIRRTGLKERAQALRAYFPNKIESAMQAEYFVARARDEIFLLKKKNPAPNSAQFWPSMVVKALHGLEPTQQLLESGLCELDKLDDEVPWPADIQLAGLSSESR